MVRPDSSQTQPTIAAGCTFDNDTQQIGCLVKTSPCSIAYAGGEAADGSAPFDNLALRMGGVAPTEQNILNLVTGGTPAYPISHAWWLNSFQDPLIGFALPNLTAGESALSACMGLPGLCTTSADCTGVPGPGNPPCDVATGRCTTGDHTRIDLALSNQSFVVIPPGIPRLRLDAISAKERAGIKPNAMLVATATATAKARTFASWSRKAATSSRNS
jgi:hypothetical protein